ncbi:MAG: Fe-S protein assembly chaperone HscA [Planctomycetales bacterium]|nr:Fe-S protein assembly chaperone HscA [Planctomycetales bacterium]
MTTPIVGIDLGTTFSLVGYVEGGAPRIVPDPRTGDRLLPSVVHVREDGSVAVGWEPRRRRVVNVGSTVVSVKRLMGKGPDEVRREEPRLPYEVLDPVLGAGRVARLRVRGKVLTPPEVSAMVLRELRGWTAAAFGEEATRAVITVPAYFNDAQRQATRDAGRIAGLDVVRILNEPTAASLAYGLDRIGEGTVAVYDLGGGTFDLSILRVRKGVFEVLATNGDTRLGGDDVDAAVAAWLLAEAARETGLADLESDPEVREAALFEAEAAKCRLSVETATRVRLSVPRARLDWGTALSREQLEALSAPVVDRTVRPCRQALRDARLEAKDLSAVVLVGGQTRMPLVRRRVAEIFGCVGRCDLDPDEVVALGAAVQAGIIEGKVRGVTLLDVIPLTLGIEAMGGLMSKVLPRNTTIPCSVSEMYTTAVDGQNSVEIHVLQGEREMSRDNRSLARFQLKPIEALPAGLPRIEVTFAVDENGLLRVSAKDCRTLRQQGIEVVPTYGLTETEIHGMIEESYDRAEEDVESSLLASGRVEADLLVRRVRKALAEPDFASGDERVAIEAAVGDAEAAARGSDRLALLGALHQLEAAAQEAMQRRADRVLGAALRDRRIEELL